MLFPPPADMSTFVRDNAVRFPDDVALEDADTGARLTWAALDIRVDAIAAVLTERLGLVAGDRVAFLAADTVDTLAVLFAGMRQGSVFVPLNRRLSIPELEALCKDAEPTVLLHDDEWSTAAAALAEAAGLRTASLEPLLAEASGRRPPRSWAPMHAFGPDDPIMLLYTSGTTGLPKGAIISESMLAAQLANVLDSLDLGGPGARHLSALPLFHAAGILAITVPTLIRGGCVLVARRFDAAQVATILSDPKRGVTHFSGAPIMWQLIAEASAPDASFAHLRAGQVGGGQIPEDVYDFFDHRGLQLQIGWGATEMGPSTTMMPRGRAGAPPRGVGRMVPLCRLRVVAEDGTDVATGEVGEAWLSGPNISPGYWRKPLAEDQARVDGWYRCGDAVSVDVNGHVTFHGRFKDMYKSGGENVFAAEVEHVLLAFPGIAEATVIGVPHRRWGEAGRALIVADPGTTVDRDELVRFCRERLAGYKVPADVVFCSELPRNVTGKVQKTALLRSYGSPIEA
jgi:fatty-acyl-CoA synthase